LQAQHSFQEAIEELRQALEVTPRNYQGWLTLASIQVVRGEFDDAWESCRQLVSSGNVMMSGVCLAWVDSLRGKLPESLQQFQRLVQSVPRLSEGEAQWVYGIGAEMADRSCDRGLTKDYLNRAFEYGQPDVYLLSAWADFKVRAGEGSQVTNRIPADTGSDTLLLWRVLAQRQSGSPNLEEESKLRERFLAAKSRGDASHLREAAYFALDVDANPAEALKLARANWDIQRERLDVRILARASQAASDSDAFEVVTSWLDETGFQDCAIPGQGAVKR
jgi:tetratricopeptide (TPR) repeat protein